MKPIHALVACSLLGSIWLTSCGGSNKKSAPPFGDAGEAGDTSGGSAGKAQGGGGAAPTEAGAAGEGGTPSEGGASGAGEGGSGGEGGAPLACFSGDIAAAGATGVSVGEGGASGVLQLSFACQAAASALAPVYDPLTKQVTLDVSQLGPVAKGKFTYYYEYTQDNGGDGTSTAINCKDDAALQVTDGKVVLQVETAETPTRVLITALQAQDQCGSDATLDVSGANGTCFNLSFTNNDGDWQVDCFEGSCYPTCAIFND